MDPSIIAFMVSLTGCVAILLTEKWHHRASHDFHGESRKIHLEAVPRIGGVAVAAGMLVSVLSLRSFGDSLGLIVLSCSLPAFFVGLQEDLTKAVSAVARLLATLLSAALIWFSSDLHLVQVGIPLFDWFLSWPLIGFLVTILAIAGLAHGFNLIDGFHGLCALTTMVIFASYAYLADQASDPFLMAVSLTAFSAVLGYALFNWPFGRIFLGDGGAYFLGFWVASIGIALTVRNPDQVSPAAILLVCALPASEVVFSSLRRVLFDRNSIATADQHHLHHLLYEKVAIRWFASKSIAQPLVVVLYAPALLLFAWIPLAYSQESVANWIGVGCFGAAYLFSYRWLAAQPSAVRIETTA